jgi:hypothetical protein
MQLEFKRELAKSLAGVCGANEDVTEDLSNDMARVFAPV